MQLRSLEYKNINLVSKMILEIFTKEFEHYYSVKGLSTLNNFYSEASIRNRYETKESEFYQVENIDHKCIGVVELEKNQIVTLCLEAHHRMHGNGSEIINQISEILDAYDEILVHAAPMSISFYEKNGFEKLASNLKLNAGIIHLPMRKKQNQYTRIL